MSYLIQNKTTNPGTPAADKVNYWTNTANKRLYFTDDTGTTGPVGIGTTRYFVDDYGVTPGNSAATNVTNLNTLLQTTATDGAEIIFGVGTYQFNAGLTTLTKDFCFRGIYGQTTIAITADMGSGVPFLKLQNTGYYTSFFDLNWVNFATQTTNYVIMGQNNANPQFINCFFTGASNWSGVLDFTGTSAGNGAVIKNLYVSQFSAKAINVVSPLSTMYVEDLLIIGAGVANSIGLYCSDGGAVLLSNCQMISCDVNVKLDPANGKTVSAIFAVNCFFDQGKTNCLLITGAGTGTVARCHFVGCWFTISGTASVGGAGSNTKCIQITTAGSGIHAGIQFQDCEIMNATTGSTGTLEGILATSVQDFTVMGCQFAGWTNDIQVTPASAGTCAPTIVGNTFASWGLIAASTNNVILNVGAPTTYGQINITSNSFNGSTSKLTDNSTLATGAQKIITGNVGLVGIGTSGIQSHGTAAQSLTASSANLVTGTSLALPTNGLRIGTKIRFDIGQIKTAAGAATWTAVVKYGVNNTTADAAIATFTSGTNTAAIDQASLTIVMEVMTLGAAATARCVAIYCNTLTNATGFGTLPLVPGSTATFNSTSANPFVHVDITPGASAVTTAIGSVSVVN